MYYHKLASDIEDYIKSEIMDSIYYSKLAQKAPTSLAQDILMEFSRDELGHAECFKRAYYYLTGKPCSPESSEFSESPDIPGFEDALKERILAETRDYKKYGQHYLEAPNKYIRDLFFMARTAEAQHAMRIPILFEEKG